MKHLLSDLTSVLRRPTEPTVGTSRIAATAKSDRFQKADIPGSVLISANSSHSIQSVEAANLFSPERDREKSEMSIAELGALGEFIGSFGVIATLIYLAIQIRANTRTTRAEASYNALHSWAQLNEDLAKSSDDVIEPFVGIYEETKDFTELTDVQHLRFTLLTRAIFDKLEGQYFLYKYGQLDPELWQIRARVAQGILELPYYAQWWKTTKSAYTKSFVAEIESARPMRASNINRRWERG